MEKLLRYRRLAVVSIFPHPSSSVVGGSESSDFKSFVYRLKLDITAESV